MNVDSIKFSDSTYQNNNTSYKFHVKDLPNDSVCFRGKIKTTESMSVIKRLAALLGLGATAAAGAAGINETSQTSYRDYVDIDKYDFPEGSSITLPNGESVDLNEYANNNSFEYWNYAYKPTTQEFIVLDPNSTEKQLKKFIPELKRNFDGTRLVIPGMTGYGSTWINLNEKNILIETKDSDGKHKYLYRADYINNYVPIEAVENGESGKIEVNKVPYGKKINCYVRTPHKRFFVPAGSQITINNEVYKAESDSIAGKIYENSVLDLDSDLASFVFNYKPTESNKSQEMFSAIRNSANEGDLYVKSAMGVKFECLRENGKIKAYKIGNVKFEVIGNVRMARAYDYYFDKLEATPAELDKLYMSYLAHPNLKKNGGEISLNRDNGSINVR